MNTTRTTISLGQVLSHTNVREGVKLTDDVISSAPGLVGVAKEVLREVTRLVSKKGVRGTWVRNSFLRDVAKRVDDGDELTTAQARGVLNVLLGNARRARGKFWSSGYGQEFRRHRGNPSGFGGRGDDDCRVCGKPLGTVEELRNGLGKTCYRRVLTT